MKKRILCNLLVLVLLLGMLPVTALAGGGSQVVWSEDFEDSETWNAWTSIDANYDVCGWTRDGTEESCTMYNYACSPRPLGEDVTPAASDDYLISPAIELPLDFEYELTFDARMIQAEDGPPYSRTDFYVIDADYPQFSQSMKNMPYLCFEQVMPYPNEGWKSYRFDLTAYAGKKICLVFHHIDQTANQYQLDNFQLTQYEYDSHIERICVTNVPEPEVGLSVEDMRESGIVIADTVNLALVPGSLEYYKTVNEHYELVTGAFEDGGEYDVVFQLQVKDGAFTYADAIGSVNGRKAFVTLDDKGTEDDADDIIEIGYYYGYLHAPQKPLDTLPLFLTPPVAGKTPDFEAYPRTDAFTKTALYWCEVYEDYSESPMMSASDHYEAGKRYRCYFELKPDEGFCFTDHVQAIVNGDTALRHDAGLSDGGLWFFADYEALEDDSCTIRFCTEYGDTPAPITGRIGAWMQLPHLPDQPNAKFAGWGFQVDAGASDAMNGSLLFSGSRTLYAIWLDAITAPEVGICTYGAGSDAFHTTVVIDPYADFSVVEQVPHEPVLWWTDKADVGKPGLRFRGQFEAEKTYYGRLVLTADSNHYFPAEAAQTMAFSGAEPDQADVNAQQMCIDFHLDVPGDKTLQSARICVPTRIPGYPVDATTNIGVYSLTPGVNAEPSTGLWAQKEDVGDYTNVYVGSQKPGQTYYGEFILRPTGSVIINEDIQLTIDGASEISRYTRDDAPGLVFVIYAVKIMDTYGFTAVRRSTDNTYPCGWFHADFESRWSTLFDFAFVPGGDHWIKAMAEPGYVFLEWRKNDGSEQVISKDNPYFFTLDNNDWNIQAVFAPTHTVSFLNAHGEPPADQTVVDGGLATEPKGLTADDYIFQGWFSDSACTQAYDFSTPVTGDLILYTGWKYAPGTVATDKTDLNEAIADAGKIETEHYTDESVAAFQAALEAAEGVQSDPNASQAAIDAALENLNNAVFGLVLKPTAVDKTWLGLLIKDAEIELKHEERYTEASLAALASALASAKDAYDHATEQSAVDAAAAALDLALNTMVGKSVDKRELEKALKKAELLNLNDYTPLSAMSLAVAEMKAESVLENDTATQEEVDKAAKDLNDFIANMEKKPGALDKAELIEQIVEADTIDETGYTEESIDALEKAVADAKEVLNHPADQAEIDAAAQTVKDAIAALKETELPFRFDDVKDESKFYFKPVYWAYKATPQITNGIDATHFGPDRGCTRGQVVTFLWRAAGCPTPAGTETGFTDVKPGAFYEKAVAWAVEKGITNGMSDTTFGPDATCTRGQIVTFLWRFRGSPEPVNMETGFTDVNKEAFYAKAVAWAVENNITKGMTATTFVPNDTCTRGQVVTFLYRSVAG